MKRTALKKQSLKTFVQTASMHRKRVVDMSERHIYPNSSPRLSEPLKGSSEPKPSETQSQSKAASSEAHIRKLASKDDASRPKPSMDSAEDKLFILPGPTYGPDFKITTADGK